MSTFPSAGPLPVSTPPEERGRPLAPPFTFAYHDVPRGSMPENRRMEAQLWVTRFDGSHYPATEEVIFLWGELVALRERYANLVAMTDQLRAEREGTAAALKPARTDKGPTVRRPEK